MLVSLDCETACAVPNCSDSQCVHGLVPHLAKITVVAVWSPTGTLVTRDLKAVETYLNRVPNLSIVMHNGKFDMRMLRHHGVHVPEARWTDDTALMGVASPEKVSDQYLEWYEAQRKEENKKLKKSFSHREAGKHSLKSMAPFFLGVAAFWETPENHDNDEYVLKDCEYTYRLYEHLLPMLKEQNTYEFYQTKLMAWSKMFLAAEERGVMLDMPKVEVGSEVALKMAADAKRELDGLWTSATAAYVDLQERELIEKYDAMATTAVAKLKSPTEERRVATGRRYSALYEDAAKKVETEINLNSPSQLKWLLRDYIGLDIHGYDGKESTDAEVLERLAAQGREDVKLLLDYREANKLATTYFPTYKELANDGVLHCSFNLWVARTGRTSSSTPNLQQVPGHLHNMFIARSGNLLLTKDLGSIEPNLVAFYTECPQMYEAVLTDGGFHARNTNIIFEQNWNPLTLKLEHPAERDAAKEIGLSILYGAGSNRVRIALMKRGFEFTEDQCKRIVRNIRDSWPGVTEFKHQLDYVAKKKPIVNMFGRKRSFVNDNDNIYMQAFNSLIQGTGSDLLLDGTHHALAAGRAAGIPCHLVMTVHDEMVSEAPEARAAEWEQIVTNSLTRYKLETPHGLVPLKVEGRLSKVWAK